MQHKLTRRPNTALKTALLEMGWTQRELARRAKVSEFYISMNIQGRYLFTDMDRMKICTALGRGEAELFNNV